MSNVRLNRSNLNERAAALKAAGGELNKRTLTPIDSRSTITANGNAQNAFAKAQEGNCVFGEGIVDSAEEIKEIGSRFFTIERDAACAFRQPY